MESSEHPPARSDDSRLEWSRPRVWDLDRVDHTASAKSRTLSFETTRVKGLGSSTTTYRYYDFHVVS